jgi:CzcA family heavy metal efflux pump
MIDAVIRWSLHNRLLVLLAAVVIIVWGGATVRRMPIDVFPDLTAPTVTVLAEAHGMAPQELEVQVTFPIEAALNGAAGVRRVRSSTAVGIAVIWVEFEWGQDPYRARQIVSERLQLVRDALPPEVEPPILAPMSSIMGEIMFLALTSDRHEPMDLRTQADWALRRRLLAVPGVSQVIVLGGDVRQYQVRVDPARLVAHGLGLDDVAAAVAGTNANSSAGFLIEGGQESIIHGVGRVSRVEDIADTVLVAHDTAPVRVGDVATVALGPALKRGDGSYKAEPAVVLGIQKQPGVNTLELTARIDRLLDDLQTALPPGMTIQRGIFRQSDFIARSIDNVQIALRDGVLLVLLIVFIFLWSPRATAITVVAIPLSLLVACLCLHAFGATINTMTLGGLAIAVGELVDDAIIDVENVVRRMRENAALPPEARRPALAVVLEASREIRGSIVYATLVILLAFIPLFFLSGVEGRLLQPLGMAYVVSLTASLFVALTVTPVLCSLLLRRVPANEHHDSRLVAALKRLYLPALQGAMRRWRAVMALALAGLVAAVMAATNLGRAFLPEFNEGTLTVSAVTLPGTSLTQSNEIGAWIERILLARPEVTSVARRTGRAELDEHAQGVNAAELDVNLAPDIPDREAFLAELRDALSAVPGTFIVLGQPISHRIDHMLSGTRANIAVKIFGDDLYELRRVAARVQAAVTDVPGLVDLSTEQQTDIPQITVRLDRGALARHGLRTADVARAMETAFTGRVVSQVLEGQRSFDLVVKLDPAAVADLTALRRTPIRAADGVLPLAALATIDRDLGPNTISREQVQRKIVVMGNVAGRDVVGVVGDIQARLAARVALPEGYRVEYGGQFESAEAASGTLLVLGLLVIAGIFVLLYSAFKTLRDAAIVLLNLPFALIGGVAGVVLGGGVLSVASLVGFITLFGIATRNGIMLVAHIRHLLQETPGVSLRAAVEQAALERLAPILMTALAAGLGLVPLALSAGVPGSEIQAPMALVILCGLASSTALNMFVVPALYARFHREAPAEV